MTRSDLETFLDAEADPASRVAAAAGVSRMLADERPLGDAWSAVCSVAMNEHDPVELRRAAVRAMAQAPGAAPNQLVRGSRTTSIDRSAPRR